MKYGLAVFPAIYDSFYRKDQRLLLTQRLEPSVLYVVPKDGEAVFLENNQPSPDIDMYICSVYTRGLREFKEFAQRVGRHKIIVGGYHPTAMPKEMLRYASKVVTGYCGDIDRIIAEKNDGVYSGDFSFTPMRRDLIRQKSLCQVYPDIMPDYTVGSMVTSVGCPFDCGFCSTPNMSGRKMRVSALDYVDAEIADLKSRGVETVFIRDESFATNPKIVEISTRFRDQFKMVYSFGTGNVMGGREDIVRHLASNGWHSLNFGLEDIGIAYRKNKLLRQASALCREHGIQVVLSFIVNDDGKNKAEALANYRALFHAFCDLKPSQVCANFLMPMPGSALWEVYKTRVNEEDFVKYDSKTPILCDPGLAEWHKRMIVAVQVAYYQSETYQNEVREFACGDTLHLRIEELKKEFNLADSECEEIFYSLKTA